MSSIASPSVRPPVSDSGMRPGFTTIRTLPRPGVGWHALKWRLFAGGAITVLWLFAAFAFRDPLYDIVAVFASGIPVAGALAFYYWDPGAGRHTFRLLAFSACIQAIITSSLSILQSVDAEGLRFTPTSESFSFSVEATTLFVSCFILGAFLTSPRKHENLPKLGSDTSGPSASVAVGAALICALVSVRFALFGSTVDSVSRFGTLPLVVFNSGLFVPMLTAAYLITRRRSHVVALAIVLVGQSVITLLNSSIGAIILAMRDSLFAFVYLRRKVPRWALAAGLLFVLVLNPAKQVFRGRLAADGRARVGHANDASEALSLWGDAIEETWIDPRGRERSTEDNFRQTASRVDYNWISAHVYTFVPDRIPYQYGATYEDIPLVLVPRLLWPDKPLSATFLRSRWTVKLGLQNWESAETTSIAITAPAEAYWNFGWLGVVFVPLALGLAGGLMLRLAPREPVARAGYVVFLSISIAGFLDMVIWIVPQFVALLVSAVLAYLYCAVGKRLRHPGKKVPASGVLLLRGRL
jgi:hypothetical protein